MLECLASMPAVLNSNLSTIKAKLRTQLQLARRGKLNFCIILFMSADQRQNWAGALTGSRDRLGTRAASWHGGGVLLEIIKI